jgi:hypothetical protein
LTISSDHIKDHLESFMQGSGLIPKDAKLMSIEHLRELHGLVPVKVKLKSDKEGTVLS